MNPHNINNPVPGNPWTSTAPINCPGTSQAVLPVPQQIEITQEKEPQKRSGRATKRVRMQEFVNLLAPLYPHMLKSHLKAALILTDNDPIEARIILDLAIKFRHLKNNRVHYPYLASHMEKQYGNGTVRGYPDNPSGTTSDVTPEVALDLSRIPVGRSSIPVAETLFKDIDIKDLNFNLNLLCTTALKPSPMCPSIVVEPEA